MCAKETATGVLPSGGSLSCVRFGVSAQDVAIVLDEITDWEAPWPEGTAGIVVDLGTPIRWRSRTGCCTVRSLSVPTGGAPFEATVSYPDTIVELVPDAVGAWT